MTKQPLQKLTELSKKINVLSSVKTLLEWDQETYMPSDGIELRSQQCELLAHLIHQDKIDPQFGELLSQLIDLKTGKVLDQKLSEATQACLREWRRDYLIATKQPLDFVSQYAQIISSSSHAWQKAKEQNDFPSFAPHFEKIVTNARKMADYLGYEQHPYDALLDHYEPGNTVAALTPLFEKLKPHLMRILKKIQSRPQISNAFLTRDYPYAKQIEFSKFILKTLGFSENQARLDLTSHPMCLGLHPKDTRMTTHTLPNIHSCIFSVIHEAGHGLYNQGLKPEHFSTPLGQSASLGIDESQSRMMETIVGHSLYFWNYFFPRLQKEFPASLSDISLQEFHRGINRVSPSLIRIEADEVTYNLHIMIRFEIEKALIEGSLKVKDVPEAWNEKMRTYLGITPKTNREGCLQDIHWSVGFIGYFPTYTLGNLYAAQFFHTFSTAHPDYQKRISQGDFSQLVNWLRENIHQYGRQYTPSELLKRVTKKPLEESYFVNYLETKYQDIYG